MPLNGVTPGVLLLIRHQLTELLLNSTKSNKDKGTESLLTSTKYNEDTGLS